MSAFLCILKSQLSFLVLGDAGECAAVNALVGCVLYGLNNGSLGRLVYGSYFNLVEALFEGGHVSLKMKKPYLFPERYFVPYSIFNF